MRCIHSATLLATALLASLVGIGATPAAAATCASLVTLTLPDTTITAVEAVPAGTYTAPDGEVFTNLPGFCRVAAMLTPTPPDRIIAYKVTDGVDLFSRPVCPYPELPRYSGAGDTTKASSFVCVADRDHDDNQPPAPKYLDDGDNYPIVPVTPTDNRDHGHGDDH